MMTIDENVSGWVNCPGLSLPSERSGEMIQFFSSHKYYRTTETTELCESCQIMRETYEKHGLKAVWNVLKGENND